MRKHMALHGLFQRCLGRVFHIRAEDVRVQVAPEARWVDLFGLDPGFTGDATTEEYLEANRGEA